MSYERPDLEEIAAARWGASYGRRRHLVNHSTVKNTARGLHVPARCNHNVLLDFLDTVERAPQYGGPTARERVAGLEPCGRCYGIAVVEAIPLHLQGETP